MEKLFVIVILNFAQLDRSLLSDDFVSVTKVELAQIRAGTLVRNINWERVLRMISPSFTYTASRSQLGKINFRGGILSIEYRCWGVCTLITT